MSGWGMVSFHRTFYLETQTSRFCSTDMSSRAPGNAPSARPSAWRTLTLPSTVRAQKGPPRPHVLGHLQSVCPDLCAHFPD